MVACLPRPRGGDRLLSAGGPRSGVDMDGAQTGWERTTQPFWTFRNRDFAGVWFVGSAFGMVIGIWLVVTNSSAHAVCQSLIFNALSGGACSSVNVRWDLGWALIVLAMAAVVLGIVLRSRATGRIPVAFRTAGPAPGWYPDPQGQPVHRWWDGMTWTAHISTQLPAPGSGNSSPDAG
jgi:hypothetical protein